MGFHDATSRGPDARWGWIPAVLFGKVIMNWLAFFMGFCVVAILVTILSDR